jgi:ADP-heptose:LPS heptosyltransferase
MKTKITDEQFATLADQLNTTIHELVFAIQHAENDELEDAANCLATAQMTINQVADVIAPALATEA